jgi:hypothetical protein
MAAAKALRIPLCTAGRKTALVDRAPRNASVGHTRLTSGCCGRRSDPPAPDADHAFSTATATGCEAIVRRKVAAAGRAVPWWWSGRSGPPPSEGRMRAGGARRSKVKSVPRPFKPDGRVQGAFPPCNADTGSGARRQHRVRPPWCADRRRPPHGRAARHLASPGRRRRACRTGSGRPP